MCNYSTQGAYFVWVYIIPILRYFDISLIPRPPTQLFVACRTEKQERAWYLFSREQHQDRKDGRMGLIMSRRTYRLLRFHQGPFMQSLYSSYKCQCNYMHVMFVHATKLRNWLMNKRTHTSTPPGVNVRSTTTPDSHSVTASDTWFSWYLVVDSTLRMLQALVHIVTVHR